MKKKTNVEQLAKAAVSDLILKECGYYQAWATRATTDGLTELAEYWGQMAAVYQRMYRALKD